MNVRTTPEFVGGVIKVKTGVDLTPFIEAAATLVNRVCAGSDYEFEQFRLIETYLAAHFYAVNYPRRFQESAGDGVSEQSEQIKVDLGLAVTKWGQQAMTLDTDQSLARMNARLQDPKNRQSKVGLNWLGTPLPYRCNN